jgi:DNA polymerase III epsilon subunit-like protein
MFFRPGTISRIARGVPASELEWAAIDLETTGLDPNRDRIVEVAVVRFRGDGVVTDEYCSLVNPQRRMGGNEIHQLTGPDVRDAPLFADVLPDLVRMLSGAIAIAHKMSFEDGFLAAEFGRLGRPGLGVPGVCSLDTTRAQLQGKTFKLISLHKTFTNQWIEDPHTALGDARALAAMGSAMLSQTPTALHYQGPPPVTAMPTSPSMRRIAPRPVEVQSPRLGDLARRFPRCSVEYQVDPQARQTYLAELRRVAEDEVITIDESARLEKLARRAGLTQQTMEAAHHQVWVELTSTNGEDPTSKSVLRRRERLAVNLGLRGSARLSPEQAAQQDAEAVRPRPDRYLNKWRIGIDPAPETAPLTELADRHGASVAKRLTSTVLWVAAADPDGNSVTLAKARELGLMVIPVAEAERLLNRAIVAARAAEAESISSYRHWQQTRAERAEMFRHTWLLTEQLHAMEFTASHHVHPAAVRQPAPQHPNNVQTMAQVLFPVQPTVPIDRPQPSALPPAQSAPPKKSWLRPGLKTRRVAR